jgi:hypothetical protein
MQYKLHRCRQDDLDLVGDFFLWIVHSSIQDVAQMGDAGKLVRPAWTKKQLDDAFAASGGECFYCKKRIMQQHYGTVRKDDPKWATSWQMEHLKPWSWYQKHGKSMETAKALANSVENIAAACNSCNQKKSDKPVNEWCREVGLELRCHGIKDDGLRCSFKVHPTKIHYCLHHAQSYEAGGNCVIC